MDVNKMLLLRNMGANINAISSRSFSKTRVQDALKSFKLVVIGGGSGGCSTAAKFASKLGKGNVAIIEPRETHYYQPMWTLVGGGQKNFNESKRDMKEVLPKDATWIKDKVVQFFPKDSKVVVENGDEINYDYLVVAMGLQLNYSDIKGLPEAFETPGVGSNYSSLYVEKTWKAIQDFKEGNAVFTFPNTPVKCAGAPQKIMYIAEHIMRQTGKRSKASFEYHTSLGVIFAVKKYADALWDVCKDRDINVNLRSNLVEVRPDKREAVFQDLDNPKADLKVVNYSLLHVTPPMGSPSILKAAGEPFVDAGGFLDVNKETLQHKTFKNVFGIGDCANIPTSKTAAAIAGQLGHLKKNLNAVINNQELHSKYDGYTSCPLITQPGKCILAEFNFEVPPQPLETFPLNQAIPRRSMYLLKANMMPAVYWQMLKGHWEGPKVFRKLLHLGMSA